MSETRGKRSGDRLPKLRRHKASGRAAVVLNGRWFYLGPWGDDLEQSSAEARAAYDKLIARWLAGRRKPKLSHGSSTRDDVPANVRLEAAAESLALSWADSRAVTITSLIARFWRERSSELDPAERERFLCARSRSTPGLRHQ